MALEDIEQFALGHFDAGDQVLSPRRRVLAGLRRHGGEGAAMLSATLNRSRAKLVAA